jgi:hypothetical protein
MIVALGIVILPGVIVNNLSNNGMIVPTQTSCPAGQTLSGGSCFTCSQTSPTCVLAASVGCATNPAYCQLNGQVVSFLNNCSPFTGILTLDYTGFVSSFFTNCGSGQATQTTTAYNNATLPTTGNVTISGCYYFYPVSGAGTFISECTTATPAIVGTTAPLEANYPNPTGTWDGVIGNVTAGSHPSYTMAHFSDSSNPMNFFDDSCLTYGDYTGTPYSGFVTSLICNNFKDATSTYSTTVGGLSAASIFGFALSLIGVALVLFLSLGVGISGQGGVFGTGVAGSFFSNPQGTKLVQTFGIAITLWFPLYSEFSTWFTSGYLPYGLDGVVGIVSIGLIAMFFVGTYLLSQGASPSATPTSSSAPVSPVQGTYT